MTNTELSFRQSHRLTTIADQAEAGGNPEPKVVAWDEQAHGPRIRYHDGRERAINQSGRLIPRAPQRSLERAA